MASKRTWKNVVKDLAPFLLVSAGLIAANKIIKPSNKKKKKVKRLPLAIRLPLILGATIGAGYLYDRGPAKFKKYKSKVKAEFKYLLKKMFANKIPEGKRLQK